MQVSVRLDSEMAKLLEELARETKRTKSFFIKEALYQYLEDFEDYRDAMIAIKETEEGAPTYTLDEVAKKCGIEL